MIKLMMFVVMAVVVVSVVIIMMMVNMGLMMLFVMGLVVRFVMTFMMRFVVSAMRCMSPPVSSASVTPATMAERHAAERHDQTDGYDRNENAANNGHDIPLVFDDLEETFPSVVPTKMRMSLIAIGPHLRRQPATNIGCAHRN
jgi:hypothetical protein